MNVLDSFSLQGKTAVVVGGEGLLGKVICETVMDLGGKVISIDVHVGANYVCDITDPAALGNTATYIKRADILIHAAIGNQKAVTFPSSMWDKDIEIGLTGAVRATDAFSSHLHETRGVMLYIGSDLSLKAPDPKRYRPGVKPLSYSVVKHGIVGMTRYYAALWGGKVRVNCLCPGGVDQGQKKPRCPMNRLARLEEMKGPVAFLISDASSYVTGAVLSVDGGSTCY